MLMKLPVYSRHVAGTQTGQVLHAAQASVSKLGVLIYKQVEPG